MRSQFGASGTCIAALFALSATAFESDAADALVNSANPVQQFVEDELFDNQEEVEEEGDDDDEEDDELTLREAEAEAEWLASGEGSLGYPDSELDSLDDASSPQAQLSLAAVEEPCRTLDGALCVFPFVYWGDTYSSCTSVGQKQPWCSTKVDSLGNHLTGNYGTCVDSCPQAYKTCNTVGGDKCVFPFVYKGKKYTSCTPAKKGKKPWCSTKTDSLGNHLHGKWGECVASELDTCAYGSATLELEGEPLLEENGLCMDWPPGWNDTKGRDCSRYSQLGLCNFEGPDHRTQKWRSLHKNARFSEFEKDGFSALNACCACGGGCVDAVPGWKSSRGFTCPQYYEQEFCTAWGTEGLGWNVSWGHLWKDKNQDTDAKGACCGCSGGCANKPSNWKDANGHSCDDYVKGKWCNVDSTEAPGFRRQFPRNSIRDVAVNGRSALVACCGCGGGCTDRPTDWESKDGTPCSTYAAYELCKEDGTKGPGWQRGWGSIESYSNEEFETGQQHAKEVCCACGGGSFHEPE